MNFLLSFLFDPFKKRNERKMVAGSLTPETIKKICNGDCSGEPVLQVIDMKPMKHSEEERASNSNKYRLLLSHG